MSQKIGLVSLPGLIPILQAQGYEVVSGEDFRTAAAQIRLGLQTGDAFPVLVGDGHDTHVSAAAWLRSVSANTAVVLISLEQARGLEADALKASHPAPVGLGDVLMAAGIPLPFDAAFATTINADGTVTQDHQPQPEQSPGTPQATTGARADENDPWASSSVVPGVQVPQEPITPAPAREQEDDEDLWATSSTIPNMPQAPQQPGAQAVAPEPDPAPDEPIAPAVEPEEEFTAAPTTPGTTVVDDDDEEEFDFDEVDTDPAPPAPEHEPVPQPAPASPPTQEAAAAPVAPAPIPTPPPVAEPEPTAAPEPVIEPAPAVYVPEPATMADLGDPVAAAGLDDLDSILAQSAAPHVPHAGASRAGQVIISMSGKGGSGKSSVALSLAQYAALNGPEGMRVTIVDANRGQGDLRTYLRIPSAPIPTVYDAVRTGDAAVTLSAPEVLAQYRDDQWGRLGFALLPAPPPDLANPEVVTAEVYAKAISYARSVSDLVVIDTQIHEAYDTSQLWDRVMIPLLADDAWGLAVTDTSPPGARNLVERLGALEQAGVPRDRTLITLNKVGEKDLEAAELLSTRLSGIGRYVGTVPLDLRIETEMKVGRLPHDNENLAPVLATALHIVTGLSQFDPALLDTEEPGGLTRLFRRKGRR
ncbi:hypothetical protein [Pseudactinotalea sp. Z1748]|uniref:hypothetical protein n=1 Tax=Pseudactinotalea sp. Z1748 TaxID=3413027 RepID=UPI003C7D06EE